MLDRFISIVLLCGLPGAIPAKAAAPGDRAAAASAPDLKPVTVSVVDHETGEPVTAFTYMFWYRAPGPTRPAKETWQPVESPSGTVVIQAPTACCLHVKVRSKDLKAGSRNDREFIIRSDDNRRRVVMKLERGVTVHGTVRDATTRKPIVGATVTLASMNFIWSAGDEDRQAITDERGRYELHGVDPEHGVWASHPDYGGTDDAMKEKKPGEPLFDVYLKPRDILTLRGTVRDPDGQPLEGVAVANDKGNGHTTTDGTYALRATYYALKYSKEGYVTRELSGDEAKKDGLVVVLERQVPLGGRVLGRDGRPVESFKMLVGPGQSTKASFYIPSVERAVKDPAGRFAIGLDQGGRTWVGIRAEGYAFWEAWADVARSGHTLVVQLQPGVSISGKILAPPGGLAGLQARLVPRRDLEDGRGLGSSWHVKDWAAMTTTVVGDVVLRFDHVQPDRYTLRLSGPGVTPRTMAIDVSAEGLDLGRVRLAGRGRIEGRVFRSEKNGGGPWPFAFGWARRPGSPIDEIISFVADEDGRFSVDGMYAGLVKVGFPYAVFDVLLSDAWAVQVVEGQTSKVHLLDPENSRPLPIAFQIGDGSRAQYESGTGLGARRKVDNVTTRAPIFRVDLLPRSRQPLAFVDPEWEELDLRGRIVLSDVGPGAYRLRVIDWLGLTDFEEGTLFQRDITIPADTSSIKVSLGGGSVTGRFSAVSGADRGSVPGQFPVAGADRGQVEVIAVPRGANGPVRRTRCDAEGHFCVRYLDPGDYTLFAHDPKAGWARVENVSVASNVTDIGERHLAPGGTIRGTISFGRPCAVPDAVVATGPSGVSLTIPFTVYSSFDRFELGGLWPGSWTIKVLGGGELLGIARTQIAGTEEVRVDLAYGDDGRP
jgi:hypothetical protein